MKYLFLTILSLIFGCSASINQLPNTIPDYPDTVSTTLIVKNNSGSKIAFVKWFDNSGEYYYFGYTQWTNGTSVYCGLLNGASYTNQVGAGSDYIYFYFDTGAFTKYRTANKVTVTEGKTVEFTFYGSTMIQKAE